MTEREWILGDDVVDKLNEYKTSELLEILSAVFREM